MGKPRGRPFAPRNTFGRGRPKGSRNKASQIVYDVFEEHAEAVSKKCVVRALQGNIPAMHEVFVRVAPVPKELPAKVKLPKPGTPCEDLQIARAILNAAAKGEITATQAQQFASVAERVQNARHMENEVRLGQLEQQVHEMKEKLEQTPGNPCEDLPKAS